MEERTVAPSVCAFCERWIECWTSAGVGWCTRDDLLRDPEDSCPDFERREEGR